MNCYTVGAVIIFSSIAKTVLILVEFCWLRHEPGHLKYVFQHDLKDKITPDWLCAYKISFNIFYNNN